MGWQDAPEYTPPSASAAETAPTAKEPTLLQNLTAPFQTAASMAIGAVAPPFAAAESLVTGEPYDKVRDKWAYTPKNNPRAMANLEAIGNAPVLKQVGQVMQAGGQGISDLTGGAVSPTAGTDALGGVAMLAGARPMARAAGADAGVAADAGTGGLPAWWKAAPADSPINQSILNNAWAQAIGLPGATKLTGEALSSAKKSMQRVFDYVYSPDRQIQINPQQTLQGLRQLADKYSPEVLRNPSVRKLIRAVSGSETTLDEMLAPQPGQSVVPSGTQHLGADLTPPTITMRTGMMTGEEIGDLQSQIGAAAKGIKSSLERQGLFAVQNDLRALVTKQLSPEDRALYSTTNSRYKALQQLTARTGHIDEAGNVDGAAIGRYLRRKDKNGYWMEEDSGLPQATQDAYGATHLASRGQGTASLQGVTSAPLVNKTARAVIESAKWAGFPVQWAVQKGPNALLRSLSNNATFATAMAHQLAGAGLPEDGETEE